jgi:hypothetical protein
MWFPAVSMQVSTRRRACVLDPALALSRHGLALARGLGEVLEVWLVPELWRILDNTCVYLEHPEVLVPRRDRRSDGDDAERAARGALGLWERTRYATDPLGMKLYWVGDRADESLLPPGSAPTLVPRWHLLARALEGRAGKAFAPGDPLAAAWRDSAALVAALGAAFVLTQRTAEEVARQLPPALCTSLGRWGIPTREVRNDVLLAIERDYLNHAFVHAGVAQYLWAGTHLAAVDLVVPAAAGLLVERLESEEPEPADLVSLDEPPPDLDGLWEAAQAVWFAL